MFWLPIVAAVASAALGAYQNNRIASQNDDIAAAGIIQQRANQQKVNQDVNSVLDATAASDAASERAANDSNYLQAVLRGQGRARAGFSDGGSDDYQALAGTSAANANDYASTIAGLMSRIDAGTQQRQGEANAFGGLGMDLTTSRGNIQGDQFLTDLALKGVRRNPFIDIAQAAAGGYARNANAGGG